MSFDHRPLYDLYHRVHKAINRFEQDLCDSGELLNEFESIKFEEPPLVELLSIEKELLHAVLELTIGGEGRIRCLRRFEIILKRQRKIRRLDEREPSIGLEPRRGGPLWPPSHDKPGEMPDSTDKSLGHTRGENSWIPRSSSGMIHGDEKEANILSKILEALHSFQVEIERSAKSADLKAIHQAFSDFLDYFQNRYIPTSTSGEIQ